MMTTRHEEPKQPVPFPHTEDLRKELEETHTGRLLDMPLHPHSSFGRLMKVCGYVMMKYQMQRLSLEQMTSKSGHSNQGMIGGFNKHKVIVSMVTEKIAHLSHIVKVALKLIHIVYEAMIDTVCWSNSG